MNTPYKISTDVRFSPLELIDVKRMEREKGPVGEPDAVPR
jgi:hypothetical protein